jgi:hypothetical protein
MSASSEANSLGSFFAIGVQGAKGTAATTLYRLIATESSLAPEFEYRDTRLEHPSAGGTTSWARANADQVTGYIGRATVTFPLRPKGIVPVLQATGYQVATAGSATLGYTHTLTQGTDTAHKWVTAMWEVEDSDGAYYVRAVDGRCTSLSISVSTDEIMCTAEFGFLTLAAFSGTQPTYVTEQADEIVPWIGARTDIDIGGYTVIEVIRAAEFTFTNALREDDKALWSQARVNMQRQSIDIQASFSEINASDSIYESLYYGADAGTTVATGPVRGNIDVEWRSADNISGTSPLIPFEFQFVAPSVQWQPGDAPSASGDDLITMSANGYILGDVATPSTIKVINNVATY